MIFGTRQDQRFDFSLGSGHKIEICTDFNILVLFLAEIGTSTKQRNIILSKLGRQCMYFLNDFDFDLQLYLFDHVILPVALYGCEI